MKRRTESAPPGESQDVNELLTVSEAAALLRLTRATVYRLVKTGELPSRKFGASIRVFRHRLLELAKA